MKIHNKEKGLSVYDFTKDFNASMKDVPKTLRDIAPRISEWLNRHKDALLLAWYAEYGFKPGHAILMSGYDEKGFIKTWIREATEEEKQEHNRKHPECAP